MIQLSIKRLGMVFKGRGRCGGFYAQQPAEKEADKTGTGGFGYSSFSLFHCHSLSLVISLYTTLLIEEGLPCPREGLIACLGFCPHRIKRILLTLSIGPRESGIREKWIKNASA